MVGSILRDVERFAEKMPGGFFIYRADKSEELLYANGAVLQIFGCETLSEFRDLTGFTFHRLVHPEDLPAVRRSIDAQIGSRADAVDTVEYRILRRDGAVRWVDDHGRFVHSDAGDVYYVFINDITEKRKAQAMALEIELQRQASEAKSSFLFNISHDIRTPMNAIVGFTALARRHIDDRERLEAYLEKVDESNRHMLALPIIALSANAREDDKRMSIESGMDNHIAKPFDVAHLIDTVNEHIRTAGRERKRS